MLQIISFAGIAEPAFAARQIAAFKEASDICLADIDNDGINDVVAAGYAEGISWFGNDGKMNFTRHEIADATNHGGARTVRVSLNNRGMLDFNRDGWVDFASAAMFGNRVSVWINMKNGTFTETTFDTQLVGAHTVDPLDFDDDGDIDLLVSSMGSLSTGDGSELALYRNDGAQRFTKVLIAASSNRPPYIVGADLDGDLDLVGAAENPGPSADLFWFRNDGNGAFKEIQLAFDLDHAYCAKPAYVDLDSDMDILAAVNGGGLLLCWENK